MALDLDKVSDMPVRQSIVSAAAAAPLETKAPNSVFALGGVLAAETPSLLLSQPAHPALTEAMGPAPAGPSPVPGAKRAASKKHRLVELLQEHGQLDRGQVAHMLTISEAQAGKLLSNMYSRRQLELGERRSRLHAYRLPSDIRLIKTSTPAPVQQYATQCEDKVVRAPVPPALPTPVQATVENRLICGVLSTGELLLSYSASPVSMRLSKADTVALARYLERAKPLLEES